MPNYEMMYHLTFNAITDAERLMDKTLCLLENPNPLKVEIAAMAFREARRTLITAQQKCEEIYIRSI